MKRILHIVFAVLLLASTVGITVDKHYCHGHYIGTWLYTQDDHCEMDMPMGNDWCQDDITVYSLKDSFQSTPSISSPSIKLIDILSYTIKPIVGLNDTNLDQKIAWVNIYPPPPEPNIYSKVQAFLL